MPESQMQELATNFKAATTDRIKGFHAPNYFPMDLVDVKGNHGN